MSDVLLERIAVALEKIAAASPLSVTDAVSIAAVTEAIAPVRTRTRKPAADPTPAVTPTAETATAPVQTQPAVTTSVVTAPVSPPVTTPPAASPTNATVKQVANAIEALAIAKGRDTALAVLTPFGVERVSLLKPDQLGPALAAALAAQAANAAPAAAATVASLI